MKELCSNCKYEYETDDIPFKKDFLKRQRKINWCNNCLTISDFDDSLESHKESLNDNEEFLDDEE